MTEMDIYLWLKLDEIRNIIQLPLVVGTLFFVLGTICTIASYIDSDVEIIRKPATWTAVVCGAILLFFGTIYLALPSTKQYAMIKVIPAVYNSRAIQKDAPELYSMAIGAMKEKLGSIVSQTAYIVAEDVKEKVDKPKKK